MKIRCTSGPQPGQDTRTQGTASSPYTPRPPPSNILGPWMARTTYEKSQRTNPHRLTINQHVFPTASIKRFVDELGRVCVLEVARNRPRKARPNDSIFCARRAWPHHADVGYMKKFEDAFQQLASGIIRGTISQIDDAGAKIVRDFYVLWYMRATGRHPPK
jgi:hypothetical protein